MKLVKKRNQNQRKILETLIEEIVNEQVAILLEENSALKSIFIDPFMDTAKVIKGEIEKTGTRVLGTAASVLVRAFSVLLPMFNEIPFTGKTWEEAIKGIKTRTQGAIKTIDSKYANSYKAIAGSFNNPDIAFLAFSLNPSLYLGTLFASNAIGISLSTAESMLGTSGAVSNAYSNFLSRIGIFSSEFASGGGTHIDVGMGSDIGDMGGMYENVSKKRLQKTISLLVEDAYILFEKQQQENPELVKGFKDILNIIQKQHLVVLDELARNELWKNLIEKTKNNPQNISNIIQNIINELSTATTDNILGSEKTRILNAAAESPSAINIVATSVEALAKEIAEGIKKASSSKLPETFEKFVEELKTTNDEKLKNAEKVFIEKYKSELQDKTFKSKITAANTLEAIVNVLNDKDKESIKKEYANTVTRLNAINKKENLQKQITTAINNQLKNAKQNEQSVVSPQTTNQLIEKLINKLNIAS